MTNPIIDDDDEEEASAEKPRSNYITEQGAKILRDELAHLWSRERPQVTQAVQEAAAMGDRSENAEYIYGKKRLREIDRRIRFLTKRLQALTVVTLSNTPRNQVYFGATVELLDSAETKICYQIVGPDEFDLSQNRISVDSPLAQALLRKAVGDEVIVRSPKGNLHYEIVAIHYANNGN